MKASLSFMGPFTFSSLRFITGSMIVILFVIILKLGIPPRRYWLPLAVIGFLQTAIVFLLVMFALRFVDAGKSSVLLYSMPMWSSLLAAKFLGEKMTTSVLLGSGLIILGMIITTGKTATIKKLVQFQRDT